MEETREEKYGGMPEPSEEEKPGEAAASDPEEEQKAPGHVTDEKEEEGAGTAEQAEDTDASAEDPESGESEDAEDSGETEDNAEEEPEEKGGFWKRGRKKEDKEKAALKEQNAELEDRVRRQMAEFDNFRRRTEKEKEQMFSMGEKNVLEKLLPVIDNFERGLQAIPEEEKDGAVASGMDMIYRQLIKQMEDLGVKAIESVGQEFNADYHNAVMQVDSEELESGVVAQELQKGYLYRDSVLRHSMVAVAK